MIFYKQCKRLRSQGDKLIRWLWELFAWLREPYQLWLSFIFILFLTLAIWLTGVTELKIRLMGWLLQLGGTGTVVWQIQQQLVSFNLSNPIKEWLSRFPSWNRKISNSSVSGVMTSISSQGKVIGNLSISEKTREERLKILEKKLVQLKEEIQKNQEKIERVERSNNKALQQEKQDRVARDEELKELLKDTQTDNLHIPIIGVLFLLIGTTLSTFSNELYKLFS